MQFMDGAQSFKFREPIQASKYRYIELKILDTYGGNRTYLNFVQFTTSAIQEYLISEDDEGNEESNENFDPNSTGQVSLDEATDADLFQLVQSL